MSENTDNKNKEEQIDSAATDAAAATAAPKKTDLEIAQEETAKWKNEYLYMRAEFENYKRNALKERSDLLKFGSERICRDLLEVVDNFERALEQKAANENFVKGVELIAKELKDALVKNGITEVASHGQQFNPQFHEAISSEMTTEFPEGHVSRVFKKPYKLHDKIIRMGQVVVATAPKS